MARDDEVQNIAERSGLTAQQVMLASKVILSNHCLNLVESMPPEFFLRSMRRAEAEGEIAQAMEFSAGLVCVITKEIRKEREEQEEKLRAERTEAAKRDETRQLESLREECMHIANAHLSALLIQRRQKLFKDAYGRTILDRWLKEVRYFVWNSLMPQLTPATVNAWRLARLSRRQRDDPQVVELLRKKVAFTLNDEAYELELIEVLIPVVIDYVEAEASEAQPTFENFTDPAEFELACESILRGAGWNAKRIGGTGDQGADIIASRGGITAVFQCKLYASAVGNSAVQEIYAAKSFYAANVAAVVSRNGYTKGARQVAGAIGVSLLNFGDLSKFAR